MTQDSALLPAPETIPSQDLRDGSNSRKVFIKTYGCQMNVYDSTRMSDALARDGYEQTENMDEADLVLLNTCHIREKAAEKVYSALGRLREMKKKKAADGREMMIGVTGCVAQAEGEEILRRAPAVDVVIGPQTYPACRTRCGAPSRAIASSIRNMHWKINSSICRLPKARRSARAA
ncbi:hypothetical protein AJ87_04160 [Rhizobium yanglingense]|nr:hypothetical protein AJ87_04160 [Rhizobium yanglingense]